MPSGPPELHRYWEAQAGPDRSPDGAALDFLSERGLKPNRGGVFPIPAKRKLTPEECRALDYLCMEWDYGSERVDA